MPNSSDDPNVPASYAGYISECALARVRRYDGSAKPSRMSGGASLNVGANSVFPARESRSRRQPNVPQRLDPRRVVKTVAPDRYADLDAPAINP